MKIIALTDLHGKKELLTSFGPSMKDADVVLLAGDITNFGRKNEISQIIGEIFRYNKTVLAVSGNCDYPEVEQYLSDCGILINTKCIEHKDIYFAGMSGSLPCPGRTPQEYHDEEFGAMLEYIESQIKHPLILLTHQPPYNTINDEVSGGLHVGSKSLRKFIEKNAPLVCITGHIHEGKGVDTINETRIVNPGPAAWGNYAWISIENGTIKELRIGSV